MGRHGSWTASESQTTERTTSQACLVRDYGAPGYEPSAGSRPEQGYDGVAHRNLLPLPQDLRVDELIEQVLAHDPRLEDRGIEGVPATFSWWDGTPPAGVALGLVDTAPRVPLQWSAPAWWEDVRPADDVPAEFWWTGTGELPAVPADDPSPAGTAVPEGAAAEPLPRRSARGRELPSRRTLRERARAQGSTRAVLGRRLAKGGVLAVTTLGVVAVTAPHGLTLGPPADRLGTSTAGAGMALDQLALPTTLSAVSDQLELNRLQVEQSVAVAISASASARAQASTAADVAAVAKAASQRALAVAAEQAAAEAARRQAELDRATRDVQRDPQSYARLLVEQRGWSSYDFDCLVKLWNRESMWNYRAVNPSSGAYGIPQALPGSKMGTIAADWRTNPMTQIKWGLSYIASVYGTPAAAWAHSQAYGWY